LPVRTQNDGTFGSISHRDIARKADRKYLVLLKNKKNILPHTGDDIYPTINFILQKSG